MNTNTYLSASDPDIRKPEEPELLIPPSYRIDPAWYEQQGRSLSLLLTQRMCKDSLAKLGERREVRVPVEEPSTQRVRFKRKTSTFGDDPLAIIQECCSKTDAGMHFGEIDVDAPDPAGAAVGREAPDGRRLDQAAPETGPAP